MGLFSDPGMILNLELAENSELGKMMIYGTFLHITIDMYWDFTNNAGIGSIEKYNLHSWIISISSMPIISQ